MAIVSMGLEEAPSRALPHTPEAGDPYYIGDCYERSPIANEWEINCTGKPYLAHIKSLSTAWKPLRYLADFMEVGTTPLRWKDLKTRHKERDERAERTKVTYVQVRAGQSPTALLLQDAEGLQEVAQKLSRSRSEEPSTHLLVVEDLSRDVIEILGSLFDIDPFFFREQIDDYSWYNTRDPWANPPSLMAAMKHRDWFRIRNVRLHFFESEAVFEDARQESNTFNILRRPDNDQNHWQYLDKAGSIVSLTRTKTSIWVGKTGVTGNATLGIVLVDPSISVGHPLWHGYTNWLPTPSLLSPDNTSVPPSASFYDATLKWISTYPWFVETGESASANNGIFAKPALYIVAAEWLIVCEYIKTRLGQIEWELEKPDRFRSRGDAIDASLHRLHTWRRVLPVYREMVAETLEQALPAAARLASDFPRRQRSSMPSFAFEDITQDFQRVQNALNELQARVDRLTSVVTAEISMEDSRRGLQENHNLARLTWMATTFIPLTFVSGLFSMQNNVADLKHTFGWYFLAAVPLTVIVLVVAGRVGRTWKKSKAPNSGTEEQRTRK
ncbi:hypothetical protein BDV96DRAFT_5507 [Lophiotrema nucula]|uniref:Uncharacterized protein n=1 Tax=Lophiotrema nucula TaxID=690887 RepID=A0A6A5ZV36_9PLEO|nr:hypothetical protein BDV96DRAFT_5507 [Lophiotrema nucula]